MSAWFGLAATPAWWVQPEHHCTAPRALTLTLLVTGVHGRKWMLGRLKKMESTADTLQTPSHARVRLEQTVNRDVPLHQVIASSFTAAKTWPGSSPNA
jgi:hypothetical protein